MTRIPYTTEQARTDVAALRGQVDYLTEMLAQADGTVTPNVPAAGIYAQFSTLGQMKYISGSDGGIYNTGINISYLTADATQCNTTGQGQATGLSVPVGAGVPYWFEADIFISNQSVNTIFLGMMGPSMTNFGCWTKYEQLGSGTGGVAGDAVNWGGFQGTIATGFFGSATPTVNGQLIVAHIQGACTPSASGNLSINNASSVAAASFTTKQRSVLRLFPQA